MTPIERAEQSIREVFERRAVEYGNWITEPHEVTKAWEYEGEIATDEIVRAVLQAIREPSVAMNMSGDRVLCDPDYDAKDCFAAMINAALAEGA